MNSKIYRCGWCGCPTDKEGKVLLEEKLNRVMKILHEYYPIINHVELTQGDCCRWEQETSQEQMVQITRDMAIDAGDRSLEGQWIKW